MDDWFIAGCILLIGLTLGFALGFWFDNHMVLKLAVEYCRHH